MQDGIGEMAQYLGVSVRVLELLLNAIGGTIKGSGNALVKGTAFVKACCDKEKLYGKTDFKNIIKKATNNSDPMRFYRFDEKDMEQFKKLAKNYGLLYAKVVDLNLNDGSKEIVFNESQIHQINRISEVLKSGKVITNEEYFSNADEKHQQKAQEVKQEMGKDGESIKKSDALNQQSQSKNDLKDTKEKLNKQELNENSKKTIKQKLEGFDKQIKQAKTQAKDIKQSIPKTKKM